MAETPRYIPFICYTFYLSWHLLLTNQDPSRHFKAPEITGIIFGKYFAGNKMRGHTDDRFFDSINEVFFCLVASAIRHVLKAWSTGVFIESTLVNAFKYETAARESPENPIYCTKILTHKGTYR